VSEKSKTSFLEDGVTATELEYILDVNKKAIEIHLEVERQNEQILETLGKMNDQIAEALNREENARSVLKDIQKGLDKLNSALFKLLTIFGVVGAGTIISVIQSCIHH
jgi:hypothetical protein